MLQSYFDRHTCLYAAGPSWDPDNPQPPLIYNDIVDKFYDEAAGGWIFFKGFFCFFRSRSPPSALISLRLFAFTWRNVINLEFMGPSFGSLRLTPIFRKYTVLFEKGLKFSYLFILQ